MRDCDHDTIILTDLVLSARREKLSKLSFEEVHILQTAAFAVRTALALHPPTRLEHILFSSVISEFVRTTICTILAQHGPVRQLINEKLRQISKSKLYARSHHRGRKNQDRAESLTLTQDDIS